MTTNKAVKSIAKGVALGLLWPVAAGVVTISKMSGFIATIGHESLDLARTWVNSAEEGVTEACHNVEAWTDATGAKKPEVTA